MVKRFDYDDGSMLESETGNYVLYSDYEILENKLKRVEGILTGMEKILLDCKAQAKEIQNRINNENR